MSSHAELRSRYEDFLRGERHNCVDRIVSAVDDYVHRVESVAAASSTNEKGGNNKSAATASGVAGGCPRVRISLGELRSYSTQLAQSLQHVSPLRHIRALEAACHAIASEERPGYDTKLTQTSSGSTLTSSQMKVSLAGPFSSQTDSPRTLTSSRLRHLVCVEGVATKVNSVKPKIVKSVHYNPSKSTHESREYVDASHPYLNLPVIDATGREMPDRLLTLTSSSYPTRDAENNPLETEFGLCEYADSQTVTLQEMPERAPHGQLPRSVELVLDKDLVDKIKPGDRVQIVGVYRALSGGMGAASIRSSFKTVVLVNNITALNRDVANLVFDSRDVHEIRTLSKRNDILDVLARSIAPSIHGHDVIKKALVLQLLSGVERNLENGTHLRGDVNILLVGDPSTAKSQLLRSAMTIAPLAVSTTGKGSSGVGLTAAVTSDPETRERRLEAGAMVLADRGLVCVDEFDKMSEVDRVAIHEAMEQQTVTISKAGIHASLNARCSVLAAANPVYGQYDGHRRPQENIGLPDSLLSRFDLLFIVLDQLDPTSDRRIAAHVLRGHRYRRPGAGFGVDTSTSSGYGFDDDSDSDGEDGADRISDLRKRSTSIWQKNHHKTAEVSQARMNSRRKNGRGNDSHTDEILCQDFLRKYLRFAKQRIVPVLTDGAREAIVSRYAEMRSRQDDRTLPITARSLETIIRLASAHAKARLSHTVDAEPDCSQAMDILSFALYHENKSIQSPDDSASDPATEEHSNKRLRVEDSAEMPKEPSLLNIGSKDLNTLQSVKDQIWDAVRNSDGQVSLEEIPIEDKVLKLKAISELSKEGRIMESDEVLYMV